MSAKKKKESKKERKKRCDLSWTKQRGANMQKARKRNPVRMPESWEEAEKMGILK
jgi:hypothetical protein